LYTLLIFLCRVLIVTGSGWRNDYYCKC